MTRGTALVIGGTGPTGPQIVEGLAGRGYRVSVLHGGQHEVEFAVPDVEHIHVDPHFEHTLRGGIGHRTFDLVVAQYGRLRVVSEVLRGRTGRLIGIGSATVLYAGDDDERWGGFGKPTIVPDTSGVFVRSEHDGNTTFGGKFNLRIVETVSAFMGHHAAGSYSGTYIGYPVMYGPRQPGPSEWSVVRRVLDRRERFVIADGGLRLESRLFSENAAHAVLTVVDAPEKSAGKRYSVADRDHFTMKRRVEFIAGHLGHSFDLIDMPFDLAWPCHPFYRRYREHWLCDSSSIRTELGYEDLVSPDAAMRRTIDWIVKNPPPPCGEAEQQIGDPFAYALEDELIRSWSAARAGVDVVESPLAAQYKHFYRHPKAPGEFWAQAEPSAGQRDSAT